MSLSSQVEKFHLYNGSYCLDQEIVGSRFFCRSAVTCCVTYTKIELE